MNNFKIVSTKEKNGIYFCVIPHQWEKDGILYWPEHLKHSQRESLRCDSATAPDVSCWSKFSCIVKFTGIPNFKDALNIEKGLTECADTDAEEALFYNMASNKRIKTNNSHSALSQFTDRNDLFEVLNQKSDNPTVTENQNVKIIAQNIIKPPTTSDIFLANVPNVFNTNNNHVKSIPQYNTLLVQDDVQFSFEDSAAQQPINSVEIHEFKDEIINIKNEMVNMKQEIKREYQKINVSLDKIFKMLSEITVLPNKNKTDQPPKEDILQAFDFPLVSCEEILRLDSEIRNNVEFKSQLIVFLSKIGGTSREEEGGKVAYKVIDQLFSPAVLINYTWTGISKGNKSVEKKPFQMLEGILDVFFEVISLADSRHTKQKNCNIFKEGVLKYATKRSLRKRTKPGANTDKPFEPIIEADETTANENDVQEPDVVVGLLDEPNEADNENSE